MSCDTYFSLSNLQGSSMETEIGWSTLCIPNVGKLALFVIMLVWTVVMLVASLYYLIQDFREGKHWTMRRRVHALLTIGCISEGILLILHILGVQSRGRYVLVPVIEIVVFSASMILLEVFVRVLSEIVRSSSSDRYLLLFRKANPFVIVVFCVIDYLLYAILPMVFYDSPHLLNVFYTASIAWMMFGAILITSFFGLISYRIAYLIQPSPDARVNSDLQAVKRKLMGCIAIGVTFGSMSTIGLLFPLWVGLTAVNGDPGMHGIFYFHFGYILTYHLSGYGAVLWVSFKAKGRGGTSSNTDSQSEKKLEEKDNNTNFASFSVEELNGKA